MVVGLDVDAVLRSISGMTPRTLINACHALRERRCSFGNVNVNSLLRDARIGTFQRKVAVVIERDSCLISIKGNDARVHGLRLSRQGLQRSLLRRRCLIARNVRMKSEYLDAGKNGCFDCDGYSPFCALERALASARSEVNRGECHQGQHGEKWICVAQGLLPCARRSGAQRSMQSKEAWIHLQHWVRIVGVGAGGNPIVGNERAGTQCLPGCMVAGRISRYCRHSRTMTLWAGVEAVACRSCASSAPGVPTWHWWLLRCRIRGIDVACYARPALRSLPVSSIRWRKNGYSAALNSIATVAYASSSVSAPSSAYRQ